MPIDNRDVDNLGPAKLGHRPTTKEVKVLICS